MLIKILYVVFWVWMLCFFIVLLKSLWKTRKNEKRYDSMIKKIGHREDEDL